MGRVGIPREIVRNDDEAAVTTGFERCELHALSLSIKFLLPAHRGAGNG
jgi:hypothetical protein